MLLFADDQVIMSNTEGNMQKAVYTLTQITIEYGLAVSVQKTKMMTFKGQQSVRRKIVTDKIIEQVNSFNCLGNLLSCE